MTDLNFDLNIYHYTDDELKKFLCIENNYTINILKKKINILKKNIFSLHLSNGEKNEFDTFLNKMEIRLLKDLEKIEIKKIQKDLNDKIKKLKKEIEENEKKNEENEKKVEKKIKKN
tara:strand:- start:7239 stop:7589 length:351 start_codon:yes stop_codon:yes gene_type:complete